MEVRTRFAPSPTGYLHIGGVRTALFNWLFARRHRGQFILRIDDTDRQRNLEETLLPILEGFRWLGLEWDEGPSVGGPYAPYFQSARYSRYQEIVDRLIDQGLAYRDYATSDEIQVERVIAQREKRRFIYSRRWMAETDKQVGQFEAEGRESVVRLKMPREEWCEFNDLVRGHIKFEWALEQDYVIQRTDGSFLYHLASAVDDHDFKITHVIRAAEHLSNTPRQIFIAQALNDPLPRYAHLPYVAAPGSSEKLSKRKLDTYLTHHEFKRIYKHGAAIMMALGKSAPSELFSPVIVDFYREVGYQPEALLNYLLLLGWSLDDRTEIFTREDMISKFTLERVNRSEASFDPQKLMAFEDRYMQRVPLDDKVDAAIPFLTQIGLLAAPPTKSERERLRKVITAAGERIKVTGDIVHYPEFFQVDANIAYDEKAFAKRLGSSDAVARLQVFRQRLETVEPFDAASLESELKRYVEGEGIKIGQIIHAIRVAVTGKSVGFGLFEAMEILGQSSCLARIEQALTRAVTQQH